MTASGRRWIIVPIALLASAQIACSDSSSPSGALGTRYDLTSVDAKPLPYTWRRIVAAGGSFACEDQITAGRLLFSSGRNATEILESTLVCNDGQPREPSADTAAGQYTLVGTRVNLVLQGRLTGEGSGPYEISATLAGEELHIEQIVVHTAFGVQTDVMPRVFRLTR